MNFILRTFIDIFNPILLCCDAAVNYQFGFQDPASPVREGILMFHHGLIVILIHVVILVCWLIARRLILFNVTNHPNAKPIVHGTMLEIGWTSIPALILFMVAIPSFALIYAIEEAVNPGITIKITGHQWFWSYEYSDFTNELESRLTFDSYMEATEDLALGALRLQEVDNRILLPIVTHTRLVVTAADVLHRWAIPSFGIKVDACPGRLNQVTFFTYRQGVFYGQCSEICGVNHGFMPIVVETTWPENVEFWAFEIRL